MADEIQIEVKDKVAPSISEKLRAISTQARQAGAAVENLKTQLGLLNVNALATIRKDSSAATTAINQMAIAAQRLATEQQKTAAATAMAAAAQTRANIATTQASAAQQALAVATARTAAAQAQTATAAQRLSTETQRTAVQTANAAAASDRASLATLRLQQAQQKQAQTTRDGNTALGDYVKNLITIAAVTAAIHKVLELSDAYTTLQNKLQNVTTSQGQVEELTGRLYEIANRTRTSVDDTATAFTRFDRSLKTMGKTQEETLRLTETVNKALIVSGATTAEASSALLQLSQAFNSGRLQGDEFRAVSENLPMILDAVAKATGKPINQIKQLASDGKITSQVLFDAFKLIETQVDSTFNKTIPTAAQAMQVLNNNVSQYVGQVNKATGFTSGLAEVILACSNGLKDQTKDMKDAGDQASVLGEVMTGLFEIFKTVIVFGANVGYIFKEIGNEIGGMAAQLVALAHLDFKAFSNIGDNMKADAEVARKEIDAFSKRIMDIKLKPQISASANVTLRGKGPNVAGDAIDLKAQKAAENRATALSKINAQLDNEISRNGIVSDQLAVQQKFDQIQETLLGKKITLSDAETVSIKEKLKAIQDSAGVQQKLNEIYSAAVAPLKELNDTQVAASQLLAQGKINQDQYSQAVLKSSEAYANAIDPMRQFNKDLDDQFRLLGMTQKAREIEQQIIQVQNDQLTKGITLNDAELAQLRERLTLKQQLNAVAQAEDSLLSGTVDKRQAQIDQLTAINKLLADPNSGFTKNDAVSQLATDNPGLQATSNYVQVQLDAYKNMYAQIDELRKSDVINEQDAMKAKFAIFNQQANMYYNSVSSTLDTIAQLRKSDNKEAARIGKAAAIAQAIWNTYASAVAAAQSAANIPIVGWIAAPIAAAAAVVAGMANVNAIRSTPAGYMSGGYTGNTATNEVAGVVHGKEFVMNASATSRIGVGNLQALQNGAMQVNQNRVPAAANDSKQPVVVPAPNIRMINVGTMEEARNYMNSDEGEQVVLNVMAKNGLF